MANHAAFAHRHGWDYFNLARPHPRPPLPKLRHKLRFLQDFHGLRLYLDWDTVVSIDCPAPPDWLPLPTNHLALVHNDHFPEPNYSPLHYNSGVILTNIDPANFLNLPEAKLHHRDRDEFYLADLLVTTPYPIAPLDPKYNSHDITNFYVYHNPGPVKNWTRLTQLALWNTPHHTLQRKFSVDGKTS